MPATARLPADGSRRAVGRVVLLLCVAVTATAACAAPPAPGTVAPPDPNGTGPDALPGAEEFVPAGVDGVGDWTPLSSLPNDFEITARYASPEALADAFASELAAARAGSTDRPILELDTFSEGDASAVVVISEVGAGDDSVAGTQYALLIVRDADGWRLDGHWGRALCRRGVDRSSQLCV